MASSADAKNEGLVFHPMDQFIVEPLFGAGPVHWYTVTNVTLWMALSVVALILIMVDVSAEEVSIAFAFA